MIFSSNGTTLANRRHVEPNVGYRVTVEYCVTTVNPEHTLHNPVCTL